MLMIFTIFPALTFYPGYRLYLNFVHNVNDLCDLISFISLSSFILLATLHPLLVKRNWLKLYHYVLAIIVIAAVLVIAFFGIIIGFFPSINLNFDIMPLGILIEDIFVLILIAYLAFFGMMFWLLMIKENMQYARGK